MLADDASESPDSYLELGLAGLDDHHTGGQTKVIRSFLFHVKVLPLLNLNVIVAVVHSRLGVGYSSVEPRVGRYESGEDD